MGKDSNNKKPRLISRFSFLLLIATVLMIAFISTSMFFSTQIIYSIILIDVLLAMISVITWLLLKDMEERRQAELMAVELNKRIQVTNKMLRHDILGKLAVVRGELELSELAEKNQYINDAYCNVKSAIQIVHKMKQLEQALNSNAPLKAYFLKDILKRVAHDQEIEIEVHGDGQVFVDEAVYSVFDNIIQNSNLHGNAKKVEILIASVDKQVVVSISDDGEGIVSEKMKEKLFEEGTKGPKTGNTGLGLYIVKKTLERYGAEIMFEDNLPQGAVFKLYFPRDQIKIV